MKSTDSNGRHLPIPTAGEVLSDGTMLELIRDLKNPSRLELLKWDGRQATISALVKVNGIVFAPADLEPTVLGQLQVPQGCTPYRSTRKLFSAGVDVLRQHCGLAEKYASLAMYWAFATGFVEHLPMAPRLLLTGDDISRGAQLLRLLSMFCRHCLLVTQLNSDELCKLPAGLRPTLLVCQPELSLQQERLLLAPHVPAFGVLRRGRLQDLCCAAAVFVGQRSPRSLWANTCLTIPLSPNRAPTSLLDEQTAAKLAAQFQSQFLMYRIENYRRVRNAQFDVAEFSGPTRDLARSLGLCIVNDAELQAGIVPLLRGQDELTRIESCMRLDSLVVEAMLFMCHDGQQDRVHIGEITKIVNGLLWERGETLTFKPRRVGPAVRRSLGLEDTERDRSGMAFCLSSEIRARIHQLARDWDVPSVQDGVKRCPLCAKSGDETTH